MICPSCDTHIADGLVRCPACHADLGVTLRMSRTSERWCATCGVRLPAGATTCPHCGMPVEGPLDPEPERRREDAEMLEAGEHDDLDPGATHAMARIESAVPAGPDPYAAAAEDRLPRPRTTLIASLAAVVVVGGTVLAITHPWNPSVYSTKATEPRDTSMAGFPGEVSTLTGQDQGAPVDEQTADERTYATLADAYTQLFALEDRLAASEEALRGVGLSGTQEERQAGLAEQNAASVALSNLIASIDMADVTTGTYAEDAQNLRTLGNWLRNWSDALTTAWSVSAGLDDAAGRDDEVLAPLWAAADSTGKNSYQVLFDQYAGDWAPAAPPEG